MFADFFIRRPVFASVIAILVVFVGLISIPLLPIAEFPEVTPPSVEVTATYTGAGAEVVERSVTTPIEEQINGVEGMIYMSSESTDDGAMTITVTFDIGYDLDTAAVDVENRADIARGQLPADVIKQGVETLKQEPFVTLCLNLVSPDQRFDTLYLSNYARIHITDVLSRIPGVGSVELFGEREYSMRIWLVPDKLAALNLTANDVVMAISEQNRDVAAGAIGQSPVPGGQKNRLTIQALGRLSEVSEFANIIVRADDQGAVIRIRDLGRVELGAVDYSESVQLNGEPTINICLFERAGGNSLDIAKRTRTTLEKLSKRFPPGLEYRIIYDTTRFVRESIHEVLITLGEAILLVFLVIFVFLRDWRSTLIPAITIPVSLIGTFALMKAMGFSINTLTLFGLVLAVGLVVDDAIVVLENVSRQISEHGLPPMQAASRAMKEVTAPVVATTLVLMAVFIPVAFMPGVTGQLYRQFALTIACAVGISAINALTLSPALSAILLRPKPVSGPEVPASSPSFREKALDNYEHVLSRLISHWYWVVGFFVLLVVLTVLMFRLVPTAFVPTEDQGYFMVNIQLPEGASLQRTMKVMDKVTDMSKRIPGVENVLGFGGFSFVDGATASNVATVFPILLPWEQRTSNEMQLAAIIASASADFSGIPEAAIQAFSPPAVHGLSKTGGFQFELQDLTGGSLKDLEKLAGEFVAQGNAMPELNGLFTGFSASTPQLYVDVDRTRAMMMGVSVDDVFRALQIYLGAYYVNQFNKYGRVYDVYVQAEGEVRRSQEDISRLYVRNRAGEMVPLGTLVSIRPQLGSRLISHYNLYRSAAINGHAAPGYSSGQAIAAMETLADRLLPEGYGYEWTGIVYQALKSQHQAPLIFAMALIFVFLFLAALYESWSMPFMIMLTVPLAMLGALVAQWTRGLDNDVYCQIGLVMLIGLASKNAILIVEFARRRRQQGLSIVEAALHAARVRLRPILMTALAFIFGVLPLVFASGAGSASRHSLGTAVFGGMLAATLMSLLLVPVIYVLVERLSERFRVGKPDA